MEFEISTTRFGNITVDEEHTLHLPGGLIGIQDQRWVLITREPESPFLWLQSLENGDLALPVAQPEIFFRSYALQLAEEQLQEVGMVEGHEVEVLCIVKARENVTDFTINLRGPLIIDAESRQGAQVVNMAEYPVNADLWQEIALGDVEFSHPELPIFHHQRITE